MPKPVNTTDGPGADPDPPVSFVSPEERAIIEEIVEALREIDIYELPESPRRGTIRGLLWALESLISPQIEPREQHCVPFNIRLTKDEAAVGQATIDEVWQISAPVLVGLHFLRTGGYISPWGAELPAMWSTGDFWNAIKDARAALVCLEAFTEKLYRLRYGALPQNTI